MGCSVSKNDIIDPSKRPLEIPKITSNSSEDNEQHIEINNSETVQQNDQKIKSEKNQGVANMFVQMQDRVKRDKLKKEITKQFSEFTKIRDSMKKQLVEKFGINALISDEKKKMLSLLDKKVELYDKRDELMKKVWNFDSDRIYDAFNKGKIDKALLIDIICSRTYWQMAEVSKLYERKFQCKMTDNISEHMTTVMGTNTNLSKLFTLRLTPQPERDCALLVDFTSGYYANQSDLLEIFCTRTNQELANAIELFDKTSKQNIKDMIKSKCSNKYNIEYLLNILDCKRDESGRKLTQELVDNYVLKLYNAGAGKTFGVDPDPFIKILSTVSPNQFEQISDAYNETYKDRNLMKDIEKKLNYRLKSSIEIMISNKFELLVKKLHSAIRACSVDVICRIFGCLSLPDCVKLRELYDKKYEKEKLLKNELAEIFKSQQHCLRAYITLISDPNSDGPNNCCINPIGSNKELYEEECELSNEAERHTTILKDKYKRNELLEKGNSVIKSVKSKEILQENNPTEEQIIRFDWNPSNNFDYEQLEEIQKNLTELSNQLHPINDKLPDEILQLEELYFVILKGKIEAEAYVRVYSNHVRYLEKYIVMNHVADEITL